MKAFFTAKWAGLAFSKMATLPRAGSQKATHAFPSSLGIQEGLLVPHASAILEMVHGTHLIASHEPGKIEIDEQLVVIGSHPACPLSAALGASTRYNLFNGSRVYC